MSDQSTKWDSRWRELLTRCHGESVGARAEFKADLLAKLKGKAAEIRSARRGDTAIRAILTQSYQPVKPSREFETRLLVNLKERQRVASETRIRTRRRTFFLSGLSGMAAAAMVLFIVWLSPLNTISGSGTTDTISDRAALSTETFSRSSSATNLRLPVPDAAVTTLAQAEPAPAGDVLFTSFGDSVGNAGKASAAQTARAVPASYSAYSAADAFGGAPLPARATALRNIEIDSGNGWTTANSVRPVDLRPGVRFRANGGTGHLEFTGGSLATVSPGTVLQATENGLAVAEGFMLVAVPDASSSPFRLHFPERDVAVEPGTELVAMVASPGKFAAGGAPAPTVMVVNGEDGRGGLALAKGKNGIGPLFASQLYRLDTYVTPDLPGRALCDAEYDDLNKLFKTETVRREPVPMAQFAGGFGGAGAGLGLDRGEYATVLTPAGFTKQGSRWVADSYRDEPTAKLQYLSDEYFGFANARRDLARELALGGEVVLDGGDGVFYEIVR